MQGWESPFLPRTTAATLPTRSRATTPPLQMPRLSNTRDSINSATRDRATASLVQLLQVGAPLTATTPPTIYSKPAAPSRRSTMRMSLVGRRSPRQRAPVLPLVQPPSATTLGATELESHRRLVRRLALATTRLND